MAFEVRFAYTYICPGAPSCVFLIYLQTTSYIFKIAAFKKINWMSSGYKGVHYAFIFINRGNYMYVYRYRFQNYMYFVSVLAYLVKFWAEMNIYIVYLLPNT